MSTSMEELLQHFQRQESPSIHHNSNISCSMSHACAPTTLTDVSAPSSPTSQDTNGQLFLVGSVPQMQRPRLATWAFSPDSGYAESVASPVTSSPPGCKKRFSASLDDISDPSGGGNKILHQESIAENETSDLENSFSLDFSQEYPSRIGCTELLVLRQPEAQHRPRYETEGSRGRIKDRSGSMCPAVQLRNFHGRSAVLQVYVAMERGAAKPHPLFRVCKVNSKRTAPAIIRTQPEDNSTILEMPFSEMNDWTIDIDCCSLVKLRNSDCDAMKKTPVSSDPSKKERPKRMGCPKVRLGFRAILTMLDGSVTVLQTASSTISCSSTLGVPEIHFISHKSCPASGGLDIVVIGRGFVRHESHLFVVEKDQDDNTLWEAQLNIAWDKFNQVHLVGTMPAYRDPSASHPIVVYLCVRNNDGKRSDFQAVSYTPVDSAENTHTVAEVAEVAREKPEQLPHARIPASVKIDPCPIQPKRPESPVLIASQPPVGVVANGNIHYLIQLPGSAQPIIITIPQSNSGNTVTQETPQFAVETDSPSEEKAFSLPSGNNSEGFDRISVDLRGGAPPQSESHAPSENNAEETCSVVAERSNYIGTTESGLPLVSDNGKQDGENGASQLDHLLREIFGFDIPPELYPQMLADAAQQQQYQNPAQQQQQQFYQSYDMDPGNAEAWMMDVEQENAAGMMDYESLGHA